MRSLLKLKPIRLFKRAHVGYVIGILMVISAFFVTYVRIHMTVVGYEIGELKDKESSLLESQGTLKMKLAQMTTRQALTQRIHLADYDQLDESDE